MYPTFTALDEQPSEALVTTIRQLVSSPPGLASQRDTTFAFFYIQCACPQVLSSGFHLPKAQSFWSCWWQGRTCGRNTSSISFPEEGTHLLAAIQLLQAEYARMVTVSGSSESLSSLSIWTLHLWVTELWAERTACHIVTCSSITLGPLCRLWGAAGGFEYAVPHPKGGTEKVRRTATLEVPMCSLLAAEWAWRT